MIQCNTESMNISTLHNHKVHTGPGYNISVISRSQSDPELYSDEDESLNDVLSPTTGEEEMDHNSGINYCNAVFNRKDNDTRRKETNLIDI